VIEYIEVSRIHPHEETDPQNLLKTIAALSDPTILARHPIHVDRETLVILDGHHRHAACLELRIDLIPCIFVNYLSDEIELLARRNDVSVSKDDVIRRALSGDLYPAKSTKHVFDEPIVQPTSG
jgi:hypothetical protein